MLGDNLKDLRLKRGLTLKEFGQLFGLAESTIAGYEKGTRKPNNERLCLFADYYGVTTDYLLGKAVKHAPDFIIDAYGTKVVGEAKVPYNVGQEKIKDKLMQLGIDIKNIDKFQQIESETESIPVIGFVPAGGPIIAEENLESFLPLPKSIIKGPNDFCLRVKGNSMKGVNIHDGDMILIHPQPIAENGQTVIAKINGEVTCKRFYKLNGKCRLEPANEDFEPIDCTDIDIIGIVTKVIKEIY